MRTVLALVLTAACTGMTGVRDHAEALVVATHCRDHACSTAPPARSLGEGCYVVDDRPYQCTTDELPAGAPSCLEVPVCAGACTVTITDGNGRVIPTERCRERWRVDREAHQPPPTCSPVRLQVAIGSGTAGSPSELPLPAALVMEVERTGKIRVMYEAEACAAHDGAVVSLATRTTGFAELDRVLRGRIAALAVPRGQCMRITLVASHFECEVEQTLD